MRSRSVAYGQSRSGSMLTHRITELGFIEQLAQAEFRLLFH